MVADPEDLELELGMPYTNDKLAEAKNTTWETEQLLHFFWASALGKVTPVKVVLHLHRRDRSQDTASIVPESGSFGDGSRASMPSPKISRLYGCIEDVETFSSEPHVDK